MRLSLIILVLIGSAPAAARAQEPNFTSLALKSVFDVQRAPAAKSMGLFQANFLDSLPPVNRALQLAVVIDSTESMSAEMQSIRDALPDMFADLFRIHDGAMSGAIVTYSDIGAAELPARALNPTFVADAESIAALIGQLKPESGRPYFPESVDLGVYTAVDQLDWSDDEQTERWMLVIGDAPPYDPQFQDTETAAKRWYDTDLLVDLANQKKVKIHCLLCPSRENERAAYEESLVKSRQFMSELANGTGGRMLDLSYPVVREQLLKSAGEPESTFARIGYVSQQQLASLRNPVGSSEPPESLRVAVLPYMPLESLDFLYDKPAVQLATELRQMLQSLPGVQTIAPRQIEDEITRLAGEGTPISQWPQALCWRLRCDYLISGDLRAADGEAFGTTLLYARDHNQAMLKLASQSTVEKLAATILNDLRQIPTPASEIQPLVSSLGGLEEVLAASVDATGGLASLDPQQRSRLIGALEALEQALGYSLGDPAAEPLLTAAADQLQAFLNQQPDHAFAHVLMASAAYNLSDLFRRRGQSEQAQSQRATAINSLKQAFQLRTQLIDRLARLEVTADHDLMVTRDIESAAAAYEEIIQFSENSPLRPVLRAHWMLMGIYSGAWQIDATHPQFIQPQKAREHVLQVMAFWPDSSEALALKRFLLWDEKTARTRTPYLPVESQPMALADANQ